MNSIDEECKAFFQKLKEESGGNPSTAVGADEIGRKLGFDQSLTKKIVQHLKDEGSIKRAGAGTPDGGTLVWITLEGVKKFGGT